MGEYRIVLTKVLVQSVTSDTPTVVSKGWYFYPLNCLNSFLVGSDRLTMTLCMDIL